MNEQELRLLVRAAVARHLGADAPMVSPGAVRPVPAAAPHDQGRVSLSSGPSGLSSQSLYAGLVNVGDSCVIEPAVSCDHCGFCKSHGY